MNKMLRDLDDRFYLSWVESKKEKEADPYGKDQKEKGAKVDSGKPAVFKGLFDYFPRACLEVAKVSTKGAEKYSWKGWEGVPEGVARYSDALGRHILLKGIQGERDSDTGLLHDAQIAWNALAILEMVLREKEKNAVLNAGS